MSLKLIIRLKNRSSEASMAWALFDHDSLVESGEVDPADSQHLLAGIAKKSHQIIVLVPGHSVLLTTVTLPKLSASRLAKALPFALEDQLVDDPANLHIAVGSANADNLIPIAIVNKAIMHSWQSQLQAVLQDAYSQVKAFIPEILVLPMQDQAITIYQEDDMCFVRTGASAGFVIDKPSVLSLLQLHVAQKDIEKPTTLICYQSESAPLISDEASRALGVQLQTEKATPQSLFLFANAINTWPLNLLQGSYAPYQRLVQFDRLIGFGFGLVAAWMLMLTFADLIQYSLLHREKKSLNSQLIQLYQAVHPTALLPAHPKETLQKELADLKVRTADSTFVRLLSTIGPSLTPLVPRGMTPLQATYRDNQLMMDVEATDAAVLEEFKQSLDSQGLKVTMSNAERSPDGLIKTRFTIEEIS